MTLPRNIPPYSTSLSRRRFIAGAGIVVTATTLPRVGLTQATEPGEIAPDGFRIVRARPATVALRGADQAPTPIWGYDGVVPGPLLRLKRGRELKIRLVNALPEPTLMHWHGVRVPNGMDGTPLTQAPVAPGASFDYRFTPPDAGTFWYHAHDNTPEQVERGLYGVLLVDEADAIDVDRDLVLVFDDWRLKPDGSLDEASFRPTRDGAPAGRPGEHLTVNSAPSLDLPVRTNERLRLRLINASNGRLIAVRFAEHRPVVMAIDGQPAEPFEARDGRVVLGPGNRVDLFVDATLAPGAAAPIILQTGTAEVQIGRLVYQAEAPARRAVRPEARRLPANALPERMDFGRALKLDVPLDGNARSPASATKGAASGPGGDPAARIWTLSGQASPGQQAPPLFTVKRGRTVMLAFGNRNGFPHSVHVHGHHFRLLDAMDDGWKPYWLDTLVVAPSQTARIAFVADNPGKWLLQCRMLEQAAAGMTAWFEVT